MLTLQSKEQKPFNKTFKQIPASNTHVLQITVIGRYLTKIERANIP